MLILIDFSALLGKLPAFERSLELPKNFSDFDGLHLLPSIQMEPTMKNRTSLFRELSGNPQSAQATRLSAEQWEQLLTVLRSLEGWVFKTNMIFK
jgi:hypothetical protein